MFADLTLRFMALRTVAPGVTEVSGGLRTFSSCPKEPVVLSLDPEHFGVDFSVFLTGNEISWTQTEFGISTVTVGSSTGLKWEISTDYGTVLSSPITYGVVPPGATQSYPPDGPPAPLSSGDDITVFAAGGTSLRGVPYQGEGSAPVP